MTRVLLDTHVFFWALAEPDRLPSAAWSVLEDPGLDLLLSIASGWEMAIKHGLGKLELPAGVRSFVADGCRDARVSLLGIELAHLDEVSALPSHHRDPFDRMMIAQARVEGIPLLSYDRALREYDVELLTP